jgi:hypothetical protein
MPLDVAVVAVAVGGSSSSNHHHHHNDKPSSSARFSDLVHKIVTRVAQEQDSPSKPAAARNGEGTWHLNPRNPPYLPGGPGPSAAAAVPTPGSSSPPHEYSASEGGPLTSEEIKALLLLSATSEDPKDRNTRGGGAQARAHAAHPGFAAVERDEIVNLVEALQAHVNYARQRGMVVDEANAVWMHGSQLGSPTQAAMALSRVRAVLWRQYNTRANKKQHVGFGTTEL